MKIAVPKQGQDGERRVPLIPAVAKRLVDQKVEVVVEAGAGLASGIEDAEFTDVGATIAPAEGGPPAAVWSEADVLVTLEPPALETAGMLKEGAVLMGMLAPLKNQDLIRKLAEKKVTAFSMEFLPRITRAQSMDVLSSQASIGGYKAVLMAADQCPKMFPMMITAAGTLAAARVFVLGAGVAGLQAIATAKRLGAVVEAFDVRAETKEQVLSLGARFVELPTAAQDGAAAGGYAKEQSEEERQKQTELMAKHIASADCVISTAAVFGKAPPMLIPADVVGRMRRGSVIVDIAAAPDYGRGNCELTKPGEVTTTDGGVTIVGTLNLPALVNTHASQAYANNMQAFLKEIVQPGESKGEEGGDTEATLKINLEDEVQKGGCITHDGQIVNEMVKNALEGAAG